MGFFWLYVGTILAGAIAAHIFAPPKAREKIRSLTRQMVKKYNEYAANKGRKPISKHRWRD